LKQDDNIAMKKLFIIICCALSLDVTAAGLDDKPQDHAEIHKVVMDFVKAKTQDMPGKVSIKVDEIDPRIFLLSCPQLEAFLPTGASMMGKTSIGIRCNEKNNWSLFIPVSITSKMNMLVSSKPLQQGQVIGAGDFSIQTGEISQPGIVTDEAQVVGKVIKFSMGAGQLLKQEMFRPPYVITQGQSVQIISEGHGFRLRSEGQAMNNAAAGQSAQVKVPSGKIISGTAKSAGIVEVQQ
jgi:flagella basal body P-ring formation protein FlgA